MKGPGAESPIGSVGEEAVKLLRALQEWAREVGDDYSDVTKAAETGGGEWFSKVNEHIATGSRACNHCPLCQLISAARATSPEVKQHMRIAASSLLRVADGLLTTRIPSETERKNQPLQRIDLDEPSDWENGDGTDYRR